MLQTSFSASGATQGDFAVIEVSSDESYIPPNRPRSHLWKETVDVLSALFSRTSVSSESETEQDKTLVLDLSPVVRPQRSTRIAERASSTRSQPHSDSSSLAASIEPELSRRSTRQKKTVPSIVPSIVSDEPATSKQVQQSSKLQKNPSKKEHVCHPPGFKEKNQDHPRRHAKSLRKSVSNPYASKGPFSGNGSLLTKTFNNP